MAQPIDIKTQLQQLIAQPNFDGATLQNLLSPAPIYIQNPTVLAHLNDILNIITQDRNGNQKFDLEDVTLMATNINAIIALVTAVVLLVSTLPSIKIEYSAVDTETFIYKILVYIFLVILPNKVNLQLTNEQLTSLLNLCNMIYDFLIQSGVLANIIKTVAAWIKKEAQACWACLSNDVNALENRMPKLKAQFKQALQK